MPNIKTQDGENHDAIEVDFESPQEEWVEYLLSDGTKLKFRTTMLSIARSGVYDENGHPLYLIKTQSQLRTYCPKELIKQNSEIVIEKQEESNPEGYR